MNALTSLKIQRYSKQGLWSLFLMCAFPIHLWTLILAFRDISWVRARTNLWDALGVVSYGMVFAFIESVIVFGMAGLFGLLVSTKWNEERRVALLGILVLIMALWAVDGQAYFVWGSYVPAQALWYIAGLEHPFRFLYGTMLAVVFLTTAIPAWLLLKSDRFFQLVQGLMERLSLLTVFYLFFDIVGLMIVVIRNV